MKKYFFVALLLLFPLTAYSAGLSGLLPLPSVPDPVEVTHEEPSLYRLFFYEQSRQQFDAYSFSMPEDPNAFLEAYGVLCENVGYTLEEDVWEGQYLCYRIVQGNRMGGALLMDCEDRMLLLVLRDMEYRPLPTPSPTPTPTCAPTRAPSSAASDSVQTDRSSGGHWEWQIKTVTCPECRGSRSCQICHGTGVYRLYGEAVPCSRFCSFCDGRGSYETRQYVYIP